MTHSVPRWRSLVVGALVATAVVALPGPASVVMAEDPPCYCSGGEYHPIAPIRIFDSRPESTGAANAPINDVAPIGSKPLTNPASTFDIQLLGRQDDPTFENGWVPDHLASGDVLAVAVSIAIVDPGASGYLGVYPKGSPSLNAVLNFDRNQTVSNLTIVRPGQDGKITLVLFGVTNATANVVVDVFGWFSMSTYPGVDGVLGPVGDQPADERDGGRVVAVPPGRLLDTRRADKPAGAVGPGGIVELPIRGATTVNANPNVTVPNDPNVVGVLLNVTAVTPSTQTFVSVLPERPDAVPTTANVNVYPGQTKNNMVMVPIGPDGKIYFYNKNGTTDIVADLVGYVERRNDETRAGRVVPLSAPFRAFDTRLAAFQAVPLGPGQAEDWSFAAFANSVTVNGLAVGNQSAMFANLANASLTRQYPTVPVQPGYLTVYPTPATAGPPPLVANLNSVETVPVSNMALVKYGTSYRVRVFNPKGYAHYVLDVSAVVLAD